MTQLEAETIIKAKYVPDGFTFRWRDDHYIPTDYSILRLEKTLSSATNEKEEIGLNFGPSSKGSTMYAGYQLRWFNSTLISMTDIESHLTKLFGSPKYRRESTSRKGDGGMSANYLPDGYFSTSLDLQWGAIAADEESFHSEWSNDLSLPGADMLARISITGSAKQLPRVVYEVKLHDADRLREFQRASSKKIEEARSDLKARTLESLTAPAR